jgi:pyruvate dehydrogenase E1 component alpha subunit
MGRATGVCGGWGGSQHLHWRNFYANGILGGTLPLAVGMALAEKRLARPAVVIAFTGDGAMGEGIVYEAFNLASLWGAPLMLVVEHNHIAQTTPTAQAMAGSLAGRLAAFNIQPTELDTSDVLEITAVAGPLLECVRQTQRPQALILHTARFGPHSKGDDTRPSEEVAQLRATRDPLAIHAPKVEQAERQAVEAEIEALIQSAFTQALADPPAALDGGGK